MGAEMQACFINDRKGVRGYVRVLKEDSLIGEVSFDGLEDMTSLRRL